jgi:hypothetical protein
MSRPTIVLLVALVLAGVPPVTDPTRQALAFEFPRGPQLGLA